MPRRQHKYHFIYKTTCLLNGKFYIGMHSTSNMNDGYMGSGLKIRHSLNKHGIANHKIEHLEFFNNRIELKQREAELVNESLLQDPLCMNLKVGGEGGCPIDGGWKLLSDSERAKFSKRGAERIAWLAKNDCNWRQRFSEMSSKLRKEFFRLGKQTLSFTGRKHKDESKEKISKSAIGKHKGSLNSQFDTCWVYSITEKKNLKIHKKDLSDYLQKGWLKGRKMKF